MSRLRENEFGNDGAAALVEALKVNTTLKGLFFRDNKIDKAASERLREAAKGREGFQSD